MSTHESPCLDLQDASFFPGSTESVDPLEARVEVILHFTLLQTDLKYFPGQARRAINNHGPLLASGMSKKDEAEKKKKKKKDEAGPPQREG